MKEAYEIALTIQDAIPNILLFTQQTLSSQNVNRKFSVDACAVEAEKETISAVNVQKSVCKKCASSKPLSTFVEFKSSYNERGIPKRDTIKDAR